MERREHLLPGSSIKLSTLVDLYPSMTFVLMTLLWDCGDNMFPFIYSWLEPCKLRLV